MILHSLNPANTSALVMEWWTVHAETLTPVHVTVTGGPGTANTARLTVVLPDIPPGVTPFRSHPDRNESISEIARDVIEEICRNYFLNTRLAPVLTATADEAGLPGHLLLFKADGTFQGVCHTRFPRMIVPAMVHDESELSYQASHWTVDGNLSGEGWAYYLDGCQQALDELAPAFHAAAAKE